MFITVGPITRCAKVPFRGPPVARRFPPTKLAREKGLTFAGSVNEVLQRLGMRPQMLEQVLGVDVAARRAWQALAE